MRRLCLHLLGTFRVRLDDQPVSGFRTQKARALLAYLAVEARPHARDHLAGLFWAERPDPVARTYLRQALANLRRILDSDASRPPLLLADHHTVQIDPAFFWLDSVELAEALSGLASCAARDAEQAAIARLEQAAALYRGDFLQGFSLEDCEAYQEWQLQTAQSIQRQMLDALGRLSDWHGRQGDYTRAQQFARQRVELEPWVEEGHQQLMRMLALGGETSTALAHYQHYRRRLASELHAAPDPMTQALYESIQQRGLTAAHGILPTSDSILSAETPNNLVAPLTALVGRSREVEVVESLLRRSDVRLVTLTGTGGVGKTRLSEQIAADLLNDFGDGVYFVSLAPVRNPELMPSVVARVLGQREAQHRSALDVLKAALRAKTVLLVLDNFEQILPAAPVVADLLRACPRLKILVTSREALRVRGEHEYVVPPLALPPPTALPVSDLAQYSAIEVFRQRAVAARGDFVLDESTSPAVVRICERLGGLPLAIELAAARIRRLSPQALLQQFEDDPSGAGALHQLRAHARDVPERHRSLWDAIAWSYALLEDQERVLFRWLAAFVGGWTAEAAAYVCSTSAGMIINEALESLADKHLVEAHPDGTAIRYTMLEPLREFGLEQMRQTGEMGSVQARMATYFVQVAENAHAAMFGAGYAGAHRTLLAEHANIQAVLSWALAEREVDICLRLCGALQHFWNDYPARSRAGCTAGARRRRGRPALGELHLRPHHCRLLCLVPRKAGRCPVLLRAWAGCQRGHRRPVSLTPGLRRLRHPRVDHVRSRRSCAGGRVSSRGVGPCDASRRRLGAGHGVAQHERDVHAPRRLCRGAAPDGGSCAAPQRNRTGVGDRPRSDPPG